MPSLFSIASIVFVAVVAGLYQAVLRPPLQTSGLWRENAPYNVENCKIILNRTTTESVLDEQSGLLYLACTPVTEAIHWMPCMSNLNASGKTQDGYFATYDPSSGKIARLQITDSARAFPRGLATHGMDVVRSAEDPSEVFMYAINQCPPLVGDPEFVGADSVVEIFRGVAGGAALTHVATVEDPLIHTPNDVVGSPNGKSFWMTNDHASKADELHRTYELILRRPSTNVVYCHVDEGRKIAANALVGSNGIAKSKTNDTFYVNSAFLGQVSAFEKQTDNTLVLTDAIHIGLAVDNISVDKNGALWVAAFPKWYATMTRSKDLSVSCPAAAFSIAQNMDRSAYFGEKYKVERVFEDNGSLISFVTTAVHDVDRDLLFLGGM